MSKRAPAYYNQKKELKFFSDIQDARNKLDAIIEGSYDGIYITDGDANTVLINKSYEVVSGLSKEQVMGMNMRELVTDGVISQSSTLLAIEKRVPVTLEQEFETGKHAIVTSTPIFDDNNDIVMVVTNVRDVTELYDLKEQLVKNEELNQKYCSEIEIIRKQLISAEDLIAVDKTMLDMLRMVNKVAKLDTTVLLLGETGVGKERIATYIYKNSRRKKERFIKVNCGAIPANLMESELFGYERGAFTGANKDGKMGLLEVADNGTIFLDEIGELPLDMQVKLLRVLQEQEIERIGSSKPIKINVRVLAATNRNLEEMLIEKTFREDLYYRINVFPITIPPLRDRRDDIVPLANKMLDDLNKKYSLKKVLTQSAILELTGYRWPGNVRELKNIIERAVIMSNENEISASDLPIRADWIPGSIEPENPDQVVNLKNLVERIQLSYIDRAYDRCHNVRAAAESLQMDAATFVRKRKKYTEKFLLQK
ncbi:sigma 54-interacting transcriptional regulator [Oscillospiraceae bacterium PP1C4]